MNHTVQIAPPEHFWNERKYPTITTGPIAFPAPILPILVAFGFVFYKTLPEQLGRERNRAPNAAQQQRVQRNRFHNANNLPADAPDLQHYASNALAFFHRFSLQHAIFKSIHAIDSKRTVPSQFCYLQAAALVLGGTVFGQSSTLKPCIATGLGWTLLGLALPRSLTDQYLVAIALIALTCTLVQPKSGRTGEALSAVVLLTLACDGLLPTTHPVRVYHIFPDLETWRLMPIAVTVSGRWLIEKLHAWIYPPPDLLETAQPRSLANALFSTLTAFAQDFILAITRVLSVIGPLAASIIISAFIISCLPWKRVLSGRPSEPPAATYPALLMVSYPVLGTFVLLQPRRRQQQQRGAAVIPLPELLRESLLCSAEAVGWTVTGFFGLWTLLSYF